MYNNTSSLSHNLLQDTENYLWIIISPILLLLGISGNCLCFVVVWKMKFWRKTPLFLLAVLSITDVTVLLDGLLRYWVMYAFDLDFRNLSNAGCKINLFVLYLSMQFSAWILVCVTVDRFVKTNFPLKYIRVATIAKTSISILVILIVLSGIDLHYFWTNGLVNGTCKSVTKEIKYFEDKIFVYIDLTVMSLVPSVVIISLNCFIYRALQQQEKFRNKSVVESRVQNSIQNKRRFSRKLTRMLLIVSCYFSISTLPISIYNVYDSYEKPEDVEANSIKNIVWTVTYLFQYTNYSVNFILYAAHNKVFRNKMKETIGFKPQGYVYILLKCYRFHI